MIEFDSFHKWLESATLTHSGTDIGQDSPPVNNDSEEPDDGQFSWENIKKTYGAAIQKWIDSSDCGKKIKGKILEATFATKPKIKMDQHDKKHKMIGISVIWKLPTETMVQPVTDTLRNARQCDIYKIFNIKPEDLWNFMDQGDLLDYLYYTICMSLSGLNPELIRNNTGTAGEYIKGQNNWGKDKITLQKYAQFMTKDIQDKIIKQYSDKLNIQLHEMRPVRCRGQIWENNFFAEAYLLLTY